MPRTFAREDNAGGPLASCGRVGEALIVWGSRAFNDRESNRISDFHTVHHLVNEQQACIVRICRKPVYIIF